MSVNNSLAHRIVLIITGAVPKTEPGIDGAVHAVLVQASAWLRLPPHEVSDGTKGVHPEPVSFPATVGPSKPPTLPHVLSLDGEARHLEEVEGQDMRKGWWLGGTDR